MITNYTTQVLSEINSILYPILFAVSTGVIHGDVLAPFLFVILVDYMYLMAKATSDNYTGVVTHPRRSRRHPAIVLNDKDFADDIA